MKPKNKKLLIVGTSILFFAIIFFIVLSVAKLHMWNNYYYTEWEYDPWNGEYKVTHYNQNWDGRWWTWLLDIITFAMAIIGTICVIRSFQEEIEDDNFKKENYVESRYGAIELFDDYFVAYSNFVPFRCARGKRMACIIYYDQIVNAAFRPAGWFRGTIWLWSKSCMRQRPDTKIHFSLWLPWTSRENSQQYLKIYNKIVEKMHANKKNIRENATKTMLY